MGAAGASRPPSFSAARAKAVAAAAAAHAEANVRRSAAIAAEQRGDGKLVDLSALQRGELRHHMLLGEDGKPMIALRHGTAENGGGQAPVAILPTGQQVSLAGTSSAGGPSSVGGGPKTVKQLIQEQHRDGDEDENEDEVAGEEDRGDEQRFSKYEYFIQKLEAGQWAIRNEEQGSYCFTV